MATKIITYPLLAKHTRYLYFVKNELERNVTLPLALEPVLEGIHGMICGILREGVYNEFEQLVLNDLYGIIEKCGYTLKEYGG